MEKERPLWHRIYFDPVYTAVARSIGYQGCLYRDLIAKVEALSQQFDKVKVESAVYHLASFEGQMSCNPKPLAQVAFRDAARKLMWQLLGPPPEKQAAFHRHPDGTPRMPDKRAAKKPRPRKAAAVAPVASAVEDDAPQVAASLDLQQYREARERHPGTLLLFLMGDFYEFYEEDAVDAAKVLRLTLTTRNGIGDMAGFPRHALETSLRRLLSAGHRVAICEPVASVPAASVPAASVPAEVTKVGAAETKVPVAHDVTRIVSPGTLSEPIVEPTAPDPANVAAMSAEEEFDVVFEAVQEAVQATAREMFSEPDGPGGNKLPETSPSQAHGPARRRPRTRRPVR